MSDANLANVLDSYILASRKKTYTSLPCLVEKVNREPKNTTVDVRPLTEVTLGNGDIVPAPLLRDVPVMFPSAGGAIIALPVAKGDTVLCTFCMRSFRKWYESDGSKTDSSPSNFHNITGAVAHLGLFAKNSDKNVQENLPEDALEIRYKECTISVKEGEVKIKSTETVNLEADQVILSGDAEAAVLGDTLQGHLDDLKDYVDGHTHNYFPSTQPAPEEVPTSSPLTDSPTVPDILSDHVRLK